MGAEEKACLILEHLSAGIPDARVDYQQRTDVHEFLVELAGSYFNLKFSEATLFRRNPKELREMVEQIVDRVRKHAPTPRPALVH
jgi:hypothetical protein